MHVKAFLGRILLDHEYDPRFDPLTASTGCERYFAVPAYHFSSGRFGFIIDRDRYEEIHLE